MGNHQGIVADLLKINSILINENNRHSFSLFYVIHGEYTCYKKNQKPFILKEGNYILNNSSEKLMIEQITQYNAILHLTFYFSEIEKIIGQDWRPFFNDELLEFVNEEEKQELTEKMFRLILDSSDITAENHPFTSMNYLLSFLEQLNKIVLTEQSSKEKKLHLITEHPKVLSVIKYVEEYYQQKITLQEIAQKEYLSEAYLSRLFKEETGVNFTDYVDYIRLNHAVEELRSSRLPILSIALNNGFSTGKRFSKLFKKKYGMTPNFYRKQEVAKQEDSKLEITVKEDYEIFPKVEMLQLIAQFMLNQNIQKESVDLPEHYQLKINNEKCKVLKKPEKIINIGLAENGISEDVRHQIRQIQEKIPFEYIRFSGLCDETDKKHYVIMDKHVNNHRLFGFINEMRLKPIIVLEVTKEMTIQSFKKELAYLKRVIQGYVHFEASFKSGWYLELKITEDVNFEDYKKFYNYSYHFLNNNFTTGFFGITHSYKKHDFFKEAYIWMTEEEQLPNFISFIYRDYAFKKTREESDHLEFIDKLDQLLEWLNTETQTSFVPDVLVTEWNIIASDGHVLSGTFFRSGIVMKSLVQLSTRVKGVGFWLNLESELCQDINNQDSNLSIFLHGPLRRPLFFVLTLFERVGDQVIIETDRYIVTKRFNSYYLLFYNYYYLDPADTAYENLWKTSRKEAVFNFSELKNGHYLVKKFLLDSNHGGIYNQWLKAGGTIEMDTDIQEYLLQSVVPDFQMRKIEVKNGCLEERSVLEINACYLLILNRITGD
ncbi:MULTISPECIES: helix-turn-helix domain-containing protein [Vagococcus]|uniref:Transcriptional regulator, AraC family n=1 Tax=Vagococcus fluvialis bH819 TaxID=1255619 RepID=A0A1X6WQL3_9ENTE|nr:MULTISPECIES: helix-turn-helix domain-containing protein [Vagococcus]SLM85936.1 Transcriptional regulator, AraC family [Vagococcus fluvialis bH819]HCM88303.1 hypothetical protein [Vagococcus sp.]